MQLENVALISLTAKKKEVKRYSKLFFSLMPVFNNNTSSTAIIKLTIHNSSYSLLMSLLRPNTLKSYFFKFLVLMLALTLETSNLRFQV